MAKAVLGILASLLLVQLAGCDPADPADSPPPDDSFVRLGEGRSFLVVDRSSEHEGVERVHVERPADVLDSSTFEQLEFAIERTCADELGLPVRFRGLVGGSSALPSDSEKIGPG